MLKGPSLGENTSPNNSNAAVAINATDTIASSSTKIYRFSIKIKDDISRAVVPNIQLRFDNVIGTRGGSNVNPVNNFTDLIPVNDPDNYPDYLIRSGITNIRTNTIKAAYNYPNPFNPRKNTTKIAFYNPIANSSVKIKIFTLTGRLVRDLSLNTPQSKGSVEVEWDGKNGRGQVVRNGVYVAVIQTGSTRMMIKMAVVK